MHKGQNSGCGTNLKKKLEKKTNLEGMAII